MNEIVCFCNNVSENTIRNAIQKDKLKNLRDVQCATRAGTGCGVCSSEIRMVLKDVLENQNQTDEE